MTARTPDAEPLLTPLRSPRCSVSTPRRSRAGRRLASSRRSARSADTAVTARPRSAHCSRASRSSAAKPEKPPETGRFRVPQPGVRPSRPRTAPHSSTRRGGPPQRTPSPVPHGQVVLIALDSAGSSAIFVPASRRVPPAGCFRMTSGSSRHTPRTCADLSRTGLPEDSAGGVGQAGTRAGEGSPGNSPVASGGGAIAHIKLIGCMGRLKCTPSETLSVTPVTCRPSCPPGGGCTIGDRRSRRPTAHPPPWHRRLPACGRPWSSGGGTFVTCGRAGLRQPPQPPADRAPPGPVARADGGREVGAEQGAGRVARTGGRWALDAREGPRGGLAGNAVRAGRVRVLGGRQSGCGGLRHGSPPRGARRGRAGPRCLSTGARADRQDGALPRPTPVRGNEEGPTSEDVGPQLRS